MVYIFIPHNSFSPYFMQDKQELAHEGIVHVSEVQKIPLISAI